MNTRVGCHALLQGILLTQGSNLSLLRLLHWQAGSLPLCHQRRHGELLLLMPPRPGYKGYNRDFKRAGDSLTELCSEQQAPAVTPLCRAPLLPITCRDLAPQVRAPQPRPAAGAQRGCAQLASPASFINSGKSAHFSLSCTMYLVLGSCLL